MTVLIKKATFESIVIAAKTVYPKEFMTLLGSTKENNIIDELVVLPVEFGTTSVLIKGNYINIIPNDKTIVGSVHSHPSTNNYPSKADLRSFAKTGKWHMIIGYPYDLNSAKMYDFKGNEIEWSLTHD